MLPPSLRIKHVGYCPTLEFIFLTCGKIYGGLEKGQFCSFFIQFYFPPENNTGSLEMSVLSVFQFPPVTINEHAPCNGQFLSIFVQVLILISSPWVSCPLSM
jgi:hypothetical protein